MGLPLKQPRGLAGQGRGGSLLFLLRWSPTAALSLPVRPHPCQGPACR